MDNDPCYIVEEDTEEKRCNQHTTYQRPQFTNDQVRILNLSNLTLSLKSLIIPHCLFSNLNYRDKENLFLDVYILSWIFLNCTWN